ncbi:MAG: VCBS domain-containing protein, partial [Rhizobiales bacterium]|nr:VCBS domain-containing protein [Hyphomicrobiales bacterium]
DLDWLRAGDTLVLTYTARVNDGAGNVGAQALTITITGTNDVPAITAATNPAAIPEIAGDSSAQDIAAVTGTITVSDQDLGDTLTLSVTGNATASYNGGAVPIEDSVDISALIAAGAISFAPATSNGESVTVNWTYDPAAADLDWLRAGDTLVLTYTARVNDGAGNVGAQALTITITGTNDVPVAVADTNSTDPIVEGAGYGASLVPADSTAVGNVLANDTDEDLGETAQLRVTQIATGPTTAVVAPGTNATTGTVIVGTYGSLTIGANGTWAYQLDDADFDTQALIGNGTEVFTYTIVDPQGATATATLTLTITGTADGIFTEAADTLDLNAFINLPAGGWDGINNPTLTGTLSALGGNDDITLASTAPTAWSGLTTFTGGEGDDTIRLSEGYIGLDGGNGTDLADFSSATDVVVATLDGTYEVGSSGAQALTAFENLNGGTQSDVLTGNNGANIINGRDGDDQIDGGAGDDTLNGEGNSDLILGGSGLDTIDGGDGDDDIAGGADNDTINAGAGDDIIRYQVGTDGQDVINGGADDDELVVTGTTGNQNITVTVPAIATPTSFNVNLGPPSGNEIAASNVETLTIDAVSGTNDRLQITGANGGSAADTITASGTLTNFTVDVNGGLSVNGLNFDRLTLSGSGGDDTLDASAFLSNIFLNGNAGNDTLLGGSGNDTISGAGGRDVIVGGEGNDALTGGNDQDIFLYTFGDGLDSVVGGEGNMATDLDTVIAGGTAAGFGHATVDILGVEAFDIDLDSDSTTEISATEIEAIELFSSASTGSHVLTILGRDIDNDPPSANMPGDERLIVENSGTGGILITLAENGETILGEGFEQLLIDGRQGDDEIDLQGLLSTSNGLDAAIADVTILGGAGSDRIVVGENTRTLTVIGGETADAAFGGDAVQVIDGGNTRVTLRGDDSFEIDFKDDPALDIDATEVERVEAEGTDALGEVLLVQGRNVDSDPFFPQDERITVTSDPIFGFAVQFAENGETVSAIDFEEFVVEGRDGDDVIDISGLAQSDPTGLDTTLSAVRLLGGAGSDRFVTSSTSHVATVIGGEIGDSAFGGDVVELLDAGNVTVTYNDLEAFSVDYGSDASVEVDATEIERIEARGTAALGETLSIQGRSADPDPFFPQDERIILETDAIAGFIATLAENGEVITGIDFENLRIEGRAGDDVIDVSLLTTGPVSGLDAGLGALVLDGGDGSDRFAFSTASHGAIVIGGETGDASFGGDTVAIDGAGDIVVDFRGDESFAIDFDNDTVADVDATEIERIEIAAAGGNLTILGAEASGILSGDEVITLADEGVAGFVATYQNNGEAVSGIDVNQLNVDGRDGNDIIDASQLTTISGIGTLSINVATGNDSVSLGSGGVKTAIVNFEVGNPTGGDTLDLEALFNAGFADTDITLSNGINTETLNALLNGTSTTDFGSGFSVMLDTGSAVIEVAEVGLVGNAVSALDIMNIAFDGQRTIQV